MKLLDRRVRREAVLFLAEDRLAWLEAGQPEHLLEETWQPEERDPAAAAVRLLKREGRRPGACVLALDPSHYRRRELEIPPLAAAELRALLERKARALCGGPGPAVFQAVPLSGGRAGSAPWTYLLFAARRAELMGLLTGLGRAGFRVRRVVLAETAHLSASGGSDLPAGAAELVVAELAGIHSVSLVAPGGLALHNPLAIDAGRPSGVAPILGQELRTIDAYWRRRSRGGEIASVRFVGFDPIWREIAEPVCNLTLPDAKLAFDTAPADVPRLAWNLARLRDRHPAQLELTLRLRPRPATLAALGASTVATVVWAGVVTQGALAERLAPIEHRLEEVLEETPDLEALEARLAAREAAREELAAEWNAYLAAGALGLPVERILADGVRSLGRMAALESLEAQRVPQGVELEITAITGASARTAAGAMQAARTWFEEASEYDGVSVLPESAVPAAGPPAGAKRVHFTLEALWRAGAAREVGGQP